MVVNEMEVAVSGWWLLSLPAALILSALAVKGGAAISGGRIGFWRSIGVVILCFPASFLGVMLGGLAAGPFGALALPVILWWVVIKLIGRVGWGQAFIALILLTVCQFVITGLMAFITGLGLMGVMQEIQPYIQGEGLEVMLETGRITAA